MAMTTLAVRGSPAASQLDIVALRRVFLGLALVAMVAAPFTPDPLEFAVGGLAPWILLSIIGTPTMPAAIPYLLLWQWLQVFARALVSVTDGEPMGRSLYGPWVVSAYWYMLASLVALAVAMRMVLGSLRPPTPREANAHLAWGPTELFQFYLFGLVVATVAQYMRIAAPSLDQPLEALSRVKILTLFMLFVGVFTLRRGYVYMLAAIAIEMAIGFSGYLGDFRAVFFFLFVAALASRTRWTGGTSIVVAAGAIFLVVLGMFWTSVKTDYRKFATGSDESQQIIVPVDVRLGYMGERVADAGNIDWSYSAYLLLVRLAYVDIFGSVVGVQASSPEPGVMGQWSDALSHVFQPRVLFPNKPFLSDSDVFMRLARVDLDESIRAGTSISVGYMAENYVDLGFPWMLVGVFLLGAMLALACRYFMSLRAPWVMREGTVLVLIYMVNQNGVEVSLPKLLGVIVTTFVFYALLAKFAYPTAWRWLDRKALAQRQAAQMKEKIRASQRSSYDK